MNAPPERQPAMFPLMLDVSAAPVMLIGGASLLARLQALGDHGATAVHVFAPDAPAALAALAGDRLARRWPDAADFARIAPALVFISDMPDGEAAAFRVQAKAAHALVHVQDRIPLCDFHLPAKVRRGHLQVTVSTDGQAAGLSRLIRQYLEAEVFGPEWAARVEELAAARLAWKAEGIGIAELAARVEALVAARGWLPAKRP
ncbi:MAG: siroheme synthase [Rhodospirillaceae bacterium]|nr:siroheme synthase [Rhodospirillaceae bacterium]